MSGGVDSAVAAALLVEQGHEVTGVHLKLADVPLEDQVPGHGCCTLDDAQDARRAAQVLGIPFYVWDLSETFRREVQDPFATAYAAGITPNPCVTCNERVKYAALLDRAVTLGFDALATGHHARLRRDDAPVTAPGPGTQLHRAADRPKDQSYVLYVATRWQLDRTLLPVGEIDKRQVRDRAGALGLRVAGKPDSYDVCFVPDGDTAGYLADRLPPAPGPIVDVDGRELGQHEGVWRYTVGQRRGLGLHHHERRFVVDVDADRATVVVGPRDALACRWVEVSSPTWTTDAPVAGAVRVQVRAHGSTVPGRARQDEGTLRVELDEPVHGVALGQAAVLYDDEDRRCLGGGRITGADRPAGLPIVPPARTAGATTASTSTGTTSTTTSTRSDA
jgi:tRNA-uridine 2-sulfurtransferase